MSELALFTGPSSLSYQSNRGKPFIVENPQDIEHFANKRQFEKVGIFSKPKIEEKSIAQEDDLADLLDSVKELSNASKTKILSAYDVVSQLKDDVETNKQRFDIPEKQFVALKVALFGDDEEI